MQKKRKSIANQAFVKAVAKGTTGAAAISIGVIVLFSLALKIFKIPDEYIGPINQILKAISIVFGTMMGVGRGGEQGYIKGALTGGSYMTLGMAASMLLSMQLLSPLSIVSELALGGAIGAISGAIAANLKPKTAKSAKTKTVRAS